MRLALFIARRYFLSKRKKNFINIISGLSMVALAVATAALIIVLSVFNGLGDLLRSLNQQFDPELKVEATRGKSFLYSDSLRKVVEAVPGVQLVTEVIEDYAYVRYRQADMVATIKGVSQNFLEQDRLQGAIQGEALLHHDSVEYALVGLGVQYALSLAVADPFAPLQIYYIRSTAGRSLNPMDYYRQENIAVSGVFSVEKNIDENYILLPISFVERLMEYGARRTSLEIKTTGQTQATQQALARTLGDSFRVLTNEEQHQDLYRLLKVEKLVTFLSFVLLVLISSINIFFSLMMLVIDKARDRAVLQALGARTTLVRQIFLTEGFLIAAAGTSAGLALGALICWLQQEVGLVSMGITHAIVTNYPVSMRSTDFLLTGVVILTLTLAISAYPAWLAGKSTGQPRL